eukprot:Opistho-2@44862
MRSGYAVPSEQLRRQRASVARGFARPVRWEFSVLHHVNVVACVSILLVLPFATENVNANAAPPVSDVYALQPLFDFNAMPEKSFADADINSPITTVIRTSLAYSPDGKTIISGALYKSIPRSDSGTKLFAWHFNRKYVANATAFAVSTTSWFSVTVDETVSLDFVVDSAGSLLLIYNDGVTDGLGVMPITDEEMGRIKGLQIALASPTVTVAASALSITKAQRLRAVLFRYKNINDNTNTDFVALTGFGLPAAPTNVVTPIAFFASFPSNSANVAYVSISDGQDYVQLGSLTQEPGLDCTDANPVTGVALCLVTNSRRSQTDPPSPSTVVTLVNIPVKAMESMDAKTGFVSAAVRGAAVFGNDDSLVAFASATDTTVTVELYDLKTSPFTLVNQEEGPEGIPFSSSDVEPGIPTSIGIWSSFRSDSLRPTLLVVSAWSQNLFAGLRGFTLRAALVGITDNVMKTVDISFNNVFGAPFKSAVSPNFEFPAFSFGPQFSTSQPMPIVQWFVADDIMSLNGLIGTGGPRWAVPGLATCEPVRISSGIQPVPRLCNVVPVDIDLSNQAIGSVRFEPATAAWGDITARGVGTLLSLKLPFDSIGGQLTVDGNENLAEFTAANLMRLTGGAIITGNKKLCLDDSIGLTYVRVHGNREWLVASNAPGCGNLSYNDMRRLSDPLWTDSRTELGEGSDTIVPARGKKASTQRMTSSTTLQIENTTTHRGRNKGLSIELWIKFPAQLESESDAHVPLLRASFADDPREHIDLLLNRKQKSLRLNARLTFIPNVPKEFDVESVLGMLTADAVHLVVVTVSYITYYARVYVDGVVVIDYNFAKLGEFGEASPPLWPIASVTLGLPKEVVSEDGTFTVHYDSLAVYTHALLEEHIKERFVCGMTSFCVNALTCAADFVLTDDSCDDPDWEALSGMWVGFATVDQVTTHPAFVSLATAFVVNATSSAPTRFARIVRYNESYKLVEGFAFCRKENPPTYTLFRPSSKFFSIDVVAPATEGGNVQVVHYSVMVEEDRTSATWVFGQNVVDVDACRRPTIYGPFRSAEGRERAYITVKTGPTSCSSLCPTNSLSDTCNVTINDKEICKGLNMDLTVLSKLPSGAPGRSLDVLDIAFALKINVSATAKSSEIDNPIVPSSITSAGLTTHLRCPAHGAPELYFNGLPSVFSPLRLLFAPSSSPLTPTGVVIGMPCADVSALSFLTAVSSGYYMAAATSTDPIVNPLRFDYSQVVDKMRAALHIWFSVNSDGNLIGAGSWLGSDIVEETSSFRSGGSLSILVPSGSYDSKYSALLSPGDTTSFNNYVIKAGSFGFSAEAWILFTEDAMKASRALPLTLFSVMSNSVDLITQFALASVRAVSYVDQFLLLSVSLVSVHDGTTSTIEGGTLFATADGGAGTNIIAHVVLTQSYVTGRVMLYIDGKAVARSEYTQPGMRQPPLPRDAYIQFGPSPVALTYDEVALYDYELSATDVASHRTCGAAMICPATVCVSAITTQCPTQLLGSWDVLGEDGGSTTNRVNGGLSITGIANGYTSLLLNYPPIALSLTIFCQPIGTSGLDYEVHGIDSESAGMGKGVFSLSRDGLAMQWYFVSGDPGCADGNATFYTEATGSTRMSFVRTTSYTTLIRSTKPYFYAWFGSYESNGGIKLEGLFNNEMLTFTPSLAPPGGQYAASTSLIQDTSPYATALQISKGVSISFQNNIIPRPSSFGYTVEAWFQSTKDILTPELLLSISGFGQSDLRVELTSSQLNICKLTARIPLDNGSPLVASGNSSGRTLPLKSDPLAHFVLTSSPITGIVAMFIDGNLVFTQRDAVPRRAPPVSGSLQLSLGGAESSGAVTMDDIAIYDYAMEPRDFQWHSNCGRNGTVCPPRACYTQLKSTCPAAMVGTWSLQIEPPKTITGTPPKHLYLPMYSALI